MDTVVAYVLMSVVIQPSGLPNPIKVIIIIIIIIIMLNIICYVTTNESLSHTNGKGAGSKYQM